MTGLWGVRGFKALLPLAIAGILLVVPTGAIRAQEAEIPETTGVTDTVSDGSDSLTQAGIDADELTRRELRKLCQARPELQATKECREALERPSSAGGSLPGGSESGVISSPAGTSSGSDRASTASSGASRGQSASGRPRITVQKTNDADGNGRFTSDEVARRAGAAVPFRVLIKNVGRVSVTVQKVTDSYEGRTIDVCRQLVGDRLRRNESVRCTFTLRRYAPPSFDSKANIVEVSARKTGGGRTARASDISTVTTLDGGGDQVLGASGTNPQSDEAGSEPFASTGFFLARLISLALALIVTGTLFVRLDRRLSRGWRASLL